MEAFLQLLSLLMLPFHCQARPGAYVWGRVGDQPRRANEAGAAEFKVSASPDTKPTSASPPLAVTLEDGRYPWGAVEVEAEVTVASVEDIETFLPVSSVSAEALVAASPEVIELTSTSPPGPPAASMLPDGRYSWGAVEVEAEVTVASVEDVETFLPVSSVSAEALVSASPEVIELTPTSTPRPPPAGMLTDGRWSWGTV